MAFVDASVRNRSQSFASVRGWSDMPERRNSSRNAELSSLFTFRITKVSTVTGIGGVVIAKRRTAVTFELVSRLRLKSVNSHRARGGPGRETQNCRHFCTFVLASGERKGERREEKREMRGEKKGERREEREERRERLGDRGEERSKRREEIGEIREERGEKR